MTSVFWALRHGERRDQADPDWAESAEFVDDPGMTDTGHEQIQKAADRLRDAGIEEIYASPFYRAIESSAPVAERLHVPIRGLVEAVNQTPQLSARRPTPFDSPVGARP